MKVSLIFSLKRLFPVGELWYGLVQRCFLLYFKKWISALLQFRYRYTVFPFAVTAGAEGLYIAAALQIRPHGGAHRAGALAVNDGDGLQDTLRMP